MIFLLSIMDKILLAREKRSNLIKAKIDNSSVTNYTLVIIKANVIGVNKSPYYAYLIINVFLKRFKDNLDIINYEFYETADGPFYLLEVKSNIKEVKLLCIDLEELHPLGRLVDLDVYNKDGSFSRRELGYGFRKCLVCDDLAIKCMRNSKHTLTDIENQTNKIVRDYLDSIILELIDKSITMEATLDPKFGLVTINSNGSHPDMNFDLLMDSKGAIKDDLKKMFLYGFDNDDIATGFLKARKLGLDTEGKMYKATNNVNTYKGLIFILGIVLVAVGYALKNNRNDLFNLIKIIGKDLVKELEEEDYKTFGKYAYTNFGFLGARGEVHSGLENVRWAKELLTNYSNETLTKTLIYLIRNTEDTVLLKRSKTIEKYNYFKCLVGSIEEYNLEKINEITNECIKNNISFGGSADLLVASIFISLIEKEMGVIYE